METEHKALIYILPLHVYKHFSQLCNQIHPFFVPLHYETFLHNDPIIKQLRYTKLRHRLIGFGQPRRDGVGVLRFLKSYGYNPPLTNIFNQHQDTALLC